METNEICLEMTSRACPEQYNAFVGDQQVGYLRLRHGHFTVEVPGLDGELVYEADTRGDGEFDPSERDHHLEHAKRAITARMFPWRGFIGQKEQTNECT